MHNTVYRTVHCIGDAFLHDYSLLHGVTLACEDCARYSLVMWYRETAEDCASGGDGT